MEFFLCKDGMQIVFKGRITLIRGISFIWICLNFDLDYLNILSLIWWDYWIFR